MDLRRFLDLYVSETTEHQRLLHRSLLALEREHDSGAVDSAFRAAHTLKGLSAAMGYAAVADLAHKLEDRLAEVRAAGTAPAADVVDELLAAADVLDSAIATAIATAPPDTTDSSGAAAVGDRPPPALPAARPPGTAAIALVRLRDDAAIKGARALLIVRALGGSVLATEPASFGDDFAGDFHIFFAAGVDLTAATASIYAAGDVASVELVESATPSARAEPTRPAPRHMRVESARLDRVAERIGELSVLHGRLLLDAAEHAGLSELLARMSSLMADLQHDALSLRMVPLGEAFERLPRVVRDASRTAGRHVDLAIVGEDVELDRAILDEIGEPLVHLLRNAVDHGIEEPAARVVAGKSERGRIEVRAERERSSVRITVRDDGAGIDAGSVVARAKSLGLLPEDAPTDITHEELLRLLCQPGFSTAQQVSSLSGRGVGMDVVASEIRALGGALELHTRPGEGTTFSMRLPIALALAQALRVRVGEEEYAIPLTHLAEAVELNGNMAAEREAEQIEVRSQKLPLVRMRRLLEVPSAGEEQTAVIAEVGGRRAAIAFDELLGREQILIKGFDAVAGLLPHFAGATLLADGRPALVFDPLSVL